MNLLIEAVNNTWATVTVSGMYTGVPIKNKKIKYDIRRSSGGSWTTDDVVYVTSDSGMYTYTYRGLDSGTDYDIYITVQMQTMAGDYIDEGTLSGNFTTRGAGPAGDPYYTFTYDESSVTINVYNSGGEYLWFRCETENGSAVFDSDDYGRSRNTRERITGLQPGTQYWIRVGYSSSPSGSLTRMRSSGNNIWESFTTEGQSPISSGGCRIYRNGSWQSAKPYIYLYGSWCPATPYIYMNGQWTPCT